MKKIIVIVATIVFLSACSSSPHHTHFNNSAVNTYVHNVRSGDKYFKSVPKSKIIFDSKQVCAMLNNSESLYQIFSFELQTYPAYDSGFIVGAGVTKFCSQYLPKVRRFVVNH